MYIYFKLAVKYIISNKTKSNLVILGFSLAVALAVSIGNIFDSVITTEIYRHKINSFGYDFGYSGLKGRNIYTVKKIIHKDKNVESTGIVAQFGSSVLKDNLHIYLRSYDNTALRMFGIRLKEGAMPQRNNEVCLEQWTLLNMKNKPQIGQKFKFDFVDSNGTEKNVEFTLSGILEDTKEDISSSKNINILLLNHRANLRNDSEISIYVKLKNYAALYDKSLRILNQVNMNFSKYSELNNLQFIENKDYLANLIPLDSFSTYKVGLTLFALGIAVLLIFNLISISIA
jgi:putative ABC transport system permease protein